MEVERVRTCKLLGVISSDDLKWNAHVEYVIANLFIYCMQPVVTSI